MSLKQFFYWLILFTAALAIVSAGIFFAALLDVKNYEQEGMMRVSVKMDLKPIVGNATGSWPLRIEKHPRRPVNCANFSVAIHHESRQAVQRAVKVRRKFNLPVSIAVLAEPTKFHGSMVTPAALSKLRFSTGQPKGLLCL